MGEEMSKDADPSASSDSKHDPLDLTLALKVEEVAGTNSAERCQQPQQDKAEKSKAIQRIRVIAQKLSSHPLLNSGPFVWAVLTAVSEPARKRLQGVNILLSADEHCLGRLVEDPSFQIDGTPISANHCKIYRKKDEDADPTSTSFCFYLKDTSTNGTYLNWKKLRKASPEAKIKHGDIISFVTPPHLKASLVFVFREVSRSACDNPLKRKSEEFISDSKRLKGLGIGSTKGPISLEDVRSLQRSNTELRKKLESHIQTIEVLRGENRASLIRHENELKGLKASVSHSYVDKMKELCSKLEAKEKELVDINCISSERLHVIEDLNERLSASIQSRSDADEVIKSQETTICELEEQLNEERNLRKEEREKAAVDLKTALQRAHSEAQEEIKRLDDSASRQHREQQEIIVKLQESDKENRALVETLRSKLESTRESFVTSEKKVRQLEAQLHEEQIATANSRKKAELMESEINRLTKELESEKVAREEAWAKVSALELEIADAIRDLAFEKQRFQGARERIILRETQLRAFYSTTDEISALFAKQQEQLKAMRKTLEDEENYENTSIDINLNVVRGNLNDILDKGRQDHQRIVNAREASATSTPKNVRAAANNSSEDVSATEKHDCDMGSQDGFTQDVECTSADPAGKGFGSYIGTEPVPEGDPIDTERVLGTESEAVDIGFSQNAVMYKCSNLAGEAKPVGETQDKKKQGQQIDDEGGHGCRQDRLLETEDKVMDDTERGTVRTADLLASEVAGSWMVSTAPSVHGGNESQRSVAADNYCEAPAAGFSDSLAAASQSTPAIAAPSSCQERQALNAMIQIVAPEFKEQFQNAGGDETMSDADTKEDTSGGEDDEDDDNEENDAVMEKDRHQAMSDSDGTDGEGTGSDYGSENDT